MKVTLSLDDMVRLMEWNEAAESIELDADVFDRIGLKEAVEKVLNDETTAHAGPLYQEIRKQVDDYMNRHLPTQVGNYVRTQAHTASQIIDKTVRKEVEEGIEAGIRHFAKMKTKQLAETIASDGKPDAKELQEAIAWLLDNLPDPVSISRDFRHEKKMEDIKKLVGR